MEHPPASHKRPAAMWLTTAAPERERTGVDLAPRQPQLRRHRLRGVAHRAPGQRRRQRRAWGAEAVSARQWARIGAAATRYLAEETDGTRPCRFDLALVDGAGRLERIENARAFDGW